MEVGGLFIPNHGWKSWLPTDFWYHCGGGVGTPRHSLSTWPVGIGRGMGPLRSHIFLWHLAGVALLLSYIFHLSRLPFPVALAWVSGSCWFGIFCQHPSAFLGGWPLQRQVCGTRNRKLYHIVSLRSHLLGWSASFSPLAESLYVGKYGICKVFNCT